MTMKETVRETDKGWQLLTEGLRVLRIENELLDIPNPEISRLLTIEQALNKHQRNMVVGWLGKGRIGTVTEALEKIQKRIDQDNQQGKSVRLRPETVAYQGAGDMASGHWSP